MGMNWFTTLTPNEATALLNEGKAVYTWLLEEGGAVPLCVTRLNENNGYAKLLGRANWEAFANYWQCYGWCNVRNTRYK